MQNIDIQSAAHLIDFSGGASDLESLGKQQLEGAVALHNMLARQGIAYLADEVGMGKTYIALGVVALMRRLNPGLRVLYLLPKTNVREKWGKDYRSFVAKNYRSGDLRVKGLDEQPAAPYVVCRSMYDFLQAVATGRALDFFICTSAFSLPLGESADELKKSIAHLCELLPQARESTDELVQKLARAGQSGASLSVIKAELKHLWAANLNAILPRFDLVVVDEAHNYRHSRKSSQRNDLMARILGTGSEAATKVAQLLLLSATPFDRDLNHLRNQMTLFGHGAAFSLDRNASLNDTHQFLSKLMVRRLNVIEIGNKAHSRNMYRNEHRSGQGAEVELRVEQQLFAALLQKKVSDHLQESCHGRYELGLMASFESYLPSEKNKLVEFDGLNDRLPGVAADRDPPDRGIVETLVADFQNHFSHLPPHPKMDGVAASACEAAFKRGKKQLIFARRVRSVSELKFKMETAYDDWLEQHIAHDSSVKYWWDYYRKTRRIEHSLRDDADLENNGQGETASSDFFSWFYRGQNSELEQGGAKAPSPLPFNFRNTLAASGMFELNWATLPGMPPAAEVDIDWSRSVPRNSEPATPKSRFEQAQYAYLTAVASGRYGPQTQAAAVQILKAAFPRFVAGLDLSDPTSLAAELALQPLLTRCRMPEGLLALAPDSIHAHFEAIASGSAGATRRMLIHQRLVALVCRLDHPFIDLYSLRASRAPGRSSADQQLCDEFVRLLSSQEQAGTAFCSYQILRDIAANLDLLIKLNFENAYRVDLADLTRYLTKQLAPLAPVNGATGENSDSRSLIARRFRMPGYPRLLVSTDVFQEGEDLHTFCDQVVHYGISASPIALEQKVGRVDRVASLAHRNLQAHQAEAAQHFIQVYYPHIRDSLEYLQVRQAAANLNAFQLSLHKLDQSGQQFLSEVDIQQQLRDTSGIAPQIRTRLHTPFAVAEDDLKGNQHVARFVSEDDAIAARLKHACSAISNHLSQKTGQKIHLDVSNLVWQGEVDEGGARHPVTIQIGTCAGLPELVLCVRNGTPLKDCDDHQLGAIAIKEGDCLLNLQKLQADPRTRLYLQRGETSRADVILRDAQIFAGGEHILAPQEICDTYERVVTDFDTNMPEASSVLAPRVTALMAQLQLAGHYAITRMGPQVLRFHFDAERRVQDVVLGSFGKYTQIQSAVLGESELRAVADDPDYLLSMTLGRNGEFDTIDFHVDSDGGLSVRALHPSEHLNLEELAFITLKVAAEADRLQHILTCGDDDEDVDSDEAGARDARPSRIALDDTAHIMCTIRSLLQQGEMSRQELITRTARELGYGRAGKNIASTLRGHLRAAVRRGIARTASDILSLEAKSVADYDRNFLKEQFLAALSAESSGFIDRAVAIKAWARWMGFSRTGPVIEQTALSLINGLLRECRLEGRQRQIRRWR